MCTLSVWGKIRNDTPADAEDRLLFLKETLLAYSPTDILVLKCTACTVLKYWIMVLHHNVSIPVFCSAYVWPAG